ncbi:MAG: Hsp20 family protein, partial [Clostridiales bacterium]
YGLLSDGGVHSHQVSTHKYNFKELIFMMMIPKRRDFDLLDDMFGGVFFNEGESKLMKTDIKEKKDEYVIDIDLPGYEKEGIKLNIQDGYLTVHATVNKEEKDEEKGKFVRKERYSGECSRSFYVGENVTENEIKAKFKNGTLTIEIPKKEEKKELPEKKYIPIE